MKWLRALLPLAVLGASVAIGVVLVNTGPKAERRQPSPTVPTVEVIQALPTDFQVELHSRGTVAPRTESTLIPEVSGRVIEVAPNFREGGFFEAGDVLLKIDPRDYVNAVTMAGSELARAQVDLKEEQARAVQAKRDWKRLGQEGEPPPLVLREPQLEGAQAAVAAARARLEQAKADLERTSLAAPYAGRVLEKNVDVGQYVSPGTVLASIYAVDYVEIRLPLTNEQLEFVDLPEIYRGESRAEAARPAVDVTARVGQRDYEWRGEIVRTEGAIDARSRQLFVVAQIDDPYARRGERPPLKVGQFVEAKIRGHTLRDVYVLPRLALRSNDQVFVVDAESLLQRRAVDVVWREADVVVVRSGLEPGERVVVTQLAYGTSGTLVRVKEDEAAGESADKRRAAMNTKSEPGQGLR